MEDWLHFMECTYWHAWCVAAAVQQVKDWPLVTRPLTQTKDVHSKR